MPLHLVERISLKINCPFVSRPEHFAPGATVHFWVVEE